MTSQAIRDKVLAWHARLRRDGYGSSIGSAVGGGCAIIREGDGRPKPPCKVEFIEPPLFEE